MTPSFRVAAPAKVNLFLHVTGKKENGYHTLVTRMQKIDLCDYLSFQMTDGGAGSVEFSCSDTDLSSKDNLVVRAAELFLAKSNKLAGCGLRIFLEKNIPVAAGLGGGSSDAGITLQTLNNIAEDEFSPNELAAMAISLGADVPFFTISDSAVLAEGIGELMQPVDPVENFEFLLVNPGFSVSTAEIFRNFVLTTVAKKSKLARLRRRFFSPELMHNDLEEVTAGLYPQLAEIKKAILDAGATQALMSGSGPTVFGLFSTKTEGFRKDTISRALQRKYGEKVFWSKVYTGASPSGKAPGFDPGIRRFESKT